MHARWGGEVHDHDPGCPVVRSLVLACCLSDLDHTHSNTFGGGALGLLAFCVQ